MILDGKKLQNKRLKELKTKVSKMKKKPLLVIVQVGDKKESTIYINQKIKFGKKLGVEVEHYQLKKNVDFKFLKKLIGDFNNDLDIDGIIIQLPLPPKLNAKKVVNLVDPKKDVDGLVKDSKFTPATARGVGTLLKENNIDVKNKNVTVLGRSFLVGGPIAKLMKKEGAKVTVCHSKSKNNREKSQKADILITATGKTGLVKKNWTNEDQIIVDVGITKTKDGLRGDVDFEAVNKDVKAISPVPGGVGPMTVLSLFENLVDAAK